MRPDQNPYSPGSGRRPPELVGRTGELEAFDTLRARVANGRGDRGVVLTGLRGVGKTVLLNEMHRMAESFEWLTVRIEAHRDETGVLAVRRALARGLVVSARKVARTRLSSRTREALGTISSFNAKVGATGIELGVELNQGRADSGDPEVDLLELVEDVSLALGERRRAFGVSIDEMQDLDSETMGALIAAQHLANQQDWPFYIIAAGLPNLPRVLTETRSYAERLFNYREIGKFSHAEAARALRKPAERLGAKFAPKALDVLLDAADGYPYFIRSTGRQHGTFQLRRSSNPATRSQRCNTALSSWMANSSGRGGSVRLALSGACCVRWPPTARAHHPLRLWRSAWRSNPAASAHTEPPSSARASYTHQNTDNSRSQCRGWPATSSGTTKTSTTLPVSPPAPTAERRGATPVHFRVGGYRVVAPASVRR